MYVSLDPVLPFGARVAIICNLLTWRVGGLSQTERRVLGWVPVKGTIRAAIRVFRV